MDHVDGAPERAQAFLAKEPVLWLGTVRADGHPHLVPTWFVWDGRKILSFSKPHAVKVRAVAADPRVMIALGSPLDDFDVQLIEGEARLLDRPTDHTLAAPIARKSTAIAPASSSTSSPPAGRRPGPSSASPPRT